MGNNKRPSQANTGCDTPEFRRFTPPPMPPVKPAKEPDTVAGTNCPKCGQPVKVEYGTGYCYKCRVIVDPKPQTNADRIRSMSDEELAALLTGSLVCDYCVNNHSVDTCFELPTCTKGVMAWLKQPAKEV